jgi:hypothetical protein
LEAPERYCERLGFVNCLGVKPRGTRIAYLSIQASAGVSTRSATVWSCWKGRSRPVEYFAIVSFQSLSPLDDGLLPRGLVGSLDRLVPEKLLGEFGILRVEIAAEAPPPSVWLEILAVDLDVSSVTETLHQQPRPVLRACRRRDPVFPEDFHR